MRCLLSASLALATLAGTVCAHLPHSSSSSSSESVVGKRRKTLGFGPSHPNAVFRSSPYQIKTNGFTPQDPAMDPLEVARIFVEDVLSERLDKASSYKIRQDSYTDKNTGVTHVYVRQLVNGLEVQDGDMNINIKGGIVLSYGSSFYTGPTPAPFTNPSHSANPHSEFCQSLQDELAPHLGLSFTSISQVAMGTHLSIPPALIHLHADHCVSLSSPPPPEAFSEDPADFRSALLKFMATATPSSSNAEDILNNFGQYRDEMVFDPTHHFTSPSGADEQHVEFEVRNVPEAVNPVKARLAYTQVPTADGTSTELHLVWKFEVEMQDNWYETAVSVSYPHNIISVVDWASDSPMPIPSSSTAPIPKYPSKPDPATYNVFAWGINDPSVGNRSTVKENFDSLASPVGWHTLPYGNDPAFKGARLVGKEFWRNTTTTWGNNVFAQENWEGQNAYVNNYRPDSSSREFDYKYKPKETEKVDALEEAQKYINTTVAQLFYTSNLVHDLYYRYGFDEISGNFQQYNFGRGGAENDAVIANAQDGSGYNNANFMTPPDGQNGRMRMYLWNTAIPYRDGDLEAGIVIHELSHGLSTRLTGGPANSGCLGWGESGGMGEGWGDFLATTIRSNKEYSDYAMGAWAANRETGIRNYIYSLNETVNPSTYKTLDKPGYWGVHAIGEVWAEILWVVSQRLIEKHGYADDLFPPAPTEDGDVPEGDFYKPRKHGKGPLVPKHGNSLIVQLVLDGMKLQSCRPSFFDARDAIIQADQILTGGENFCTLWKGFAERGLGPDAKVEGRTPWGGGVRTNGYKVPLACEDY